MPVRDAVRRFDTGHMGDGPILLLDKVPSLNVDHHQSGTAFDQVSLCMLGPLHMQKGE